MPHYYEEPSTLTRVVEYEVPAEDLSAMRRDYAERVADEVGEILDWAVGSGRIDLTERSAWEPKVTADPSWGRATLELLTPHEEAAERAFAQDRRLRNLSDQTLAMLGIEKRPVEYEADDATEEERATREFLAVIGK